MSDAENSPFNAALREFEATEANLTRLDKLWEEIAARIPDGIVFGSDPEYDHLCESFNEILTHLPRIDGWFPEGGTMGLNEIAKARSDAKAYGAISDEVDTEETITALGSGLKTYRLKLNRSRKRLIRDAVQAQIEECNSVIKTMIPLLNGDPKPTDVVIAPQWESLKKCVSEIEALIGTSVKRPLRWNDLRRHLRFGELCDLRDIVHTDWPNVKSGLSKLLYTEDEPIPVGVKDVGKLSISKPKGSIATRLKWEFLTSEEFERLLFALISSERGYVNPEWLMKTKATDRGRDLSVCRVVDDSLSGSKRTRVIIQCKHWLDRSVGVSDIATLREQIALWQPPRVDVCIIATSGRFSSDAVGWIEKHNQADHALLIEMWAESHLERLLAERPHLIAEFKLR